MNRLAITEALLRDAATGRAALSTAFGPGGNVLISLVQRWNLPIRVYFLDTAQHFPETLGVLQAWRDRGVDIEVHRPGFHPALVAGDGRLWRRDPDRCCHLRKVLPNAAALATADTWLTALRRDQPGRADTPTRKEAELPSGQRILKVAPLAHWTHDEVWEFLRAHDVPHNPLHHRGYPSVGCAPCTRPARGDGTSRESRDGRWQGRAKTECGLHAPQPEPV